MFEETWKWAGLYRTSEKNIGVPHHQIREQLAILIGDTSYWIENAMFLPNENRDTLSPSIRLHTSIRERERTARAPHGRCILPKLKRAPEIQLGRR